MFVRQDKDGTVEEIVNPVYTLTVDPHAFGRQNGWYTSGDKEVIADASFQQGRGGNLIFQTPPEGWEKYMSTYHIRENQKGIELTRERERYVQPSSLRCKTLVRLPDGNRFREFQKPCSEVWATQADDGASGVKMMTQNTLDCGGD
jgi:hypothetical protein